MTIAILEDEDLTARDLIRTIAAIEPDATILPVLSSVQEAVLFF